LSDIGEDFAEFATLVLDRTDQTVQAREHVLGLHSQLVGFVHLEVAEPAREVNKILGFTQGRPGDVKKMQVVLLALAG
jgi:hypothetical protein